MSTTISRPSMTRDELDDVRWLAREAVADAVGCVDEENAPTIGLVLERAWALGAVGMEFEESSPGLSDENDQWPPALNIATCRTILAAADDIEEMYLNAPYRTLRPDESEVDPDVVSFWMPRAERVRRARAVLERGLATQEAAR